MVSIAVLRNNFLELPEKLPHASIKIFFAIYGSFCEIDVFPLGVFSIFNFNLRNLKGNGNTDHSLGLYGLL